MDVRQIAQGWYPDPDGVYHWRYWDGVRWVSTVVDSAGQYRQVPTTSTTAPRVVPSAGQGAPRGSAMSDVPWIRAAAVLGALMVFIGIMSLDWMVLETSYSNTFEWTLGDLRQFAQWQEGDGALESYAEFGYIAVLGVAGWGVTEVSRQRSGSRVPALIAGGVALAWTILAIGVITAQETYDSDQIEFGWGGMLTVLGLLTVVTSLAVATLTDRQ